MNKRQVGTEKEQIAGAYLEDMGYQIIEYNYRNRTGEIDIIAADKEYLVFVEVKYRQDERKGSPFAAVNAHKQKNICRVAEHYLLTKGRDFELPCRFDVVAICGEQIKLIKNAFEFCH